MFIMDFLYSVNDEKFYYKTLTVGGDEKKICMNKKEHESYQYKLECEKWRPVKDEEMVKQIISYSRNRLKKYFITGK